jgi:tRNA (guanosine-2'-O-)-methyltransferase
MTPARFERLQRVLRQRQPDLTIFADGVHKPHNISAILRTCDAVGISRLHAVSPSGDVKRHHMMTGGSKRWVDIVVHASSEAGLHALRGDGWQIGVADATDDAVDYRDVDFTRRIAIVMGAELLGPSEAARAAADLAITIPMHGLVESLNVSVAAAVILFEAERQRKSAGLYARCRLDEAEYRKTLFEWAQPDVARKCRERGLPYPELTEGGDLAENPFTT